MSIATTLLPPHASECSNWDVTDNWICPGCFHDLGNVGAGTHWCPECGRGVIRTVGEYPCCHARLKTQEDEE